MHEYDLYTPGQDFLFTSKDNLFLAWKVGEPITKMQYIRKSVLQYEKEWLNGLTWKSWMLHQNSEAAGTLRYMERDAAGNLHLLKDFTTAEVGTQLPVSLRENAFTTVVREKVRPQSLQRRPGIQTIPPNRNKGSPGWRL